MMLMFPCVLLLKVSITRAKALLVIVGDPSVLSLDPLWRSFMNYVHNNGGWKGPGPSWDPSEPVQDGEDYARGFQELGVANMNNLTRLMGTVALAGVQGDEHDDSTHVDRPWREVE
jgi:helicase MOV-10